MEKDSSSETQLPSASGSSGGFRGFASASGTSGFGGFTSASGSSSGFRGFTSASSSSSGFGGFSSASSSSSWFRGFTSASGSSGFGGFTSASGSSGFGGFRSASGTSEAGEFLPASGGDVGRFPPARGGDVGELPPARGGDVGGLPPASGGDVGGLPPVNDEGGDGLSPAIGGNRSVKRKRVRPKVYNSKRQPIPSGNLIAGSVTCSTHLLVNVNTGEDVIAKLLSYSKIGFNGVFLVSANGVVSNAIVERPNPSSAGEPPNPSSAGMTRQIIKGPVQILSLNGVVTFSKRGVMNGVLNIFAVDSDGQVFGGSVHGALVAASQIQMMVGLFKSDNWEQHNDVSFDKLVTKEAIVR